MSVVARLRAAQASDAADGAEFALAVDAAFEAADARHDVPVSVVSGLAVGLDDARRETRREQQQHCNSPTHETAPPGERLRMIAKARQGCHGDCGRSGCRSG